GITFNQESFETGFGKEFKLIITKTDPLLEKEVELLFLARDNDELSDNTGELTDVLCGRLKIKFIKSIEYVDLNLKFNNLANNQVLAHAMVESYKVEGVFTYEQSFLHGQKLPQSSKPIRKKQVYLKNLALYSGKIDGKDGGGTKTAFKSFWTNRAYDTEKFAQEELLKGIENEHGNRCTDENGEIKFKILKSALIGSDVVLTISLKDIPGSLAKTNYTDSIEIKIKKNTAVFESFDGVDVSDTGIVEINVNAPCACSRGLTKIDFENLAPDATASDRDSYLKGINITCNDFGIHTCLEKAHFIAQLLCESANLSATKEMGVSNTAYNGFPGRGLIQLTYESTYKFYGDFVDGVDSVFISDIAAKEKLEQLPHSYLSAGWFYTVYKGRDILKASRRDDFLHVSAIINGGFNGLDIRKANLDICKNYLKGLCSEVKLNNNTYGYEGSRVRLNSHYSFGWAIWHDSKFSSKTGVAKSDTEALAGYEKVIELNSTKKNIYDILNIAAFDEYQVTEVENGVSVQNIHCITVATKRKNDLDPPVVETEANNLEITINQTQD
ncbi:hypothetical protein BZG01_21025, partial [Labilibaculum manganireducens]